MHYRKLGNTGIDVSTVSFGAWAIGGTWGPVDDDAALTALHRAVDLGVNFIDTADVYGGGHSERLIARFRKERKEAISVATKAGRGGEQHTVQSYEKSELVAFVEHSLRNLDSEAIDLLQLHCPPTEVYYRPEVFETLDELVRAGKVRHYGVSVEKVEEALKAIEYPGVETVQIVYNLFRQRPAALFLREAERRGIGVIARLPLSSGLLSGKMTRTRQFAEDDHRNFNQQGAAFDKGETFSGLGFERGLEWVEQLRPLVPQGFSMAQFAIRWAVMNEAVSCAIPGARTIAQVDENMGAADLPVLPAETLNAVADFYERTAKPYVHQLWYDAGRCLTPNSPSSS
jgi:aryl-alcohol dehydrogenase-like predicted oxidoreductase